MKLLKPVIVTLAATVSGSLYAGNCGSTDIPVSFTVSTSYADPTGIPGYTSINDTNVVSNIVPDGKGDYVNGASGVSAVITTCNGSDSATLNPGANRTVLFNLSEPVTPGTNPLSSYKVDFFAIANVLQGPNGYQQTADYYFTTYLRGTLYTSSGSTVFFNMENACAEQAQYAAPDSSVNTPYYTARVWVHHIPKGASAVHETWVAWPDLGANTTGSCSNPSSLAAVGTYMVKNTKGTGESNAGQFKLPFYVTVQNLNN